MNKVLTKIIISSKHLKRIAIFFIQKKLRKSSQVQFGKNVYINNSVTCEGYNSFSDNTSIADSYIGYATYIGMNSQLQKVKIGRYCSVGPDLKCLFGKHPTEDFVSTHPAFFSTLKQAGFTYTSKQLFKEHTDAFYKKGDYSIIIGNDVWIGTGVTLMEGISIGDGAIIAAKTLVTKDIPAYTIVGGVPAKFIRARFTKEQIQTLLKIKWWDKDRQWIQKNSSYFTNINTFCQKFGHDKKKSRSL